MLSRREALRQFLVFVGASPLWPQRSGTTDVMVPVNLHEFEEPAKRKIHKLAYDFIAGGAEDELTLRANREAWGRVRLRPRAMVDVSKIDPSVELLGKKLAYPTLLAPTGGKNLVIPEGDLVAAQGAF